MSHPGVLLFWGGRGGRRDREQQTVIGGYSVIIWYIPTKNFSVLWVGRGRELIFQLIGTPVPGKTAV